MKKKTSDRNKTYYLSFIPNYSVIQFEIATQFLASKYLLIIFCNLMHILCKVMFLDTILDVCGKPLVDL